MDHVVWVTMTDQGPKIANLMMNGILDKKAPQGRCAGGDRPVPTEALTLKSILANTSSPMVRPETIR